MNHSYRTQVDGYEQQRSREAEKPPGKSKLFAGGGGPITFGCAIRLFIAFCTQIDVTRQPHCYFDWIICISRAVLILYYSPN